MDGLEFTLEDKAFGQPANVESEIFTWELALLVLANYGAVGASTCLPLLKVITLAFFLGFTIVLDGDFPKF